MRIYNLIGLTLMLLMQVSCIKIPLKKEFELFNPYSKGDVLVFKSDKKTTSDTLYVTRISRTYYDGIIPPFSRNYQNLSVDVFIANYFGQNNHLKHGEIFVLLPKLDIGFNITLNKNVKFYSTHEPNVELDLFKKTVTIFSILYNPNGIVFRAWSASKI